MTGYPWGQGVILTHDDLNAAFSDAYARAATAQAGATTASQTAANALTVAQASATALRPMSITLNWPAGLVVAAGTYVLTASAPYGFTVASVDASVGTAGGTVTANFRRDGVSIGNLGGLTVTAAPKTNFAASGINLTVTAGALVDVVITVSGSPTDAYLCLNGTRI